MIDSLIMTSDAQEGSPSLYIPYLSTVGKTWTIDFMIGDENYLGKGLACSTLGLFTRYIPQLIDHKVDTWLIDPAADNTKAIHVYAKAGFAKVSEFTPTKGYFAHKFHYLMLKKVKLEHDDVVLEAYNPNWPKKAKVEIEQLKEKLDFPWLVDIQHFGSTVVRGIAAKPIIDIIIAVTNLREAKVMVPIIENLGYLFWDENPKKDRFFFVKGVPPFGDQRTHHIHVFEATSYEWIARRLFRDYLNSHAQALQEYQLLKEQLADQYKKDREAYTEAKESFIKEIVQKAILPLINFKPLTEKHFPLLLKWLETPHVKAHWDPDIKYDLKLVQEKYQTYVDGYKIFNSIKKSIPKTFQKADLSLSDERSERTKTYMRMRIHEKIKNGFLKGEGYIYAFIIMCDSTPIGYIQYYNAYDFPRDEGCVLSGLPDKLAAVDIYIGEIDFIGKGLSAIILKEFLVQKVFEQFDACFVDPDRNNVSAIKAYEKAGFKKLPNQPTGDILWMINYKKDK